MAVAYGNVIHQGQLVIDATADARTEFIQKTYLHLGGAIMAFVGVSTLLVQSPFAEIMLKWLMVSRLNWLLVLGMFMVVGWIADKWARSATSTTTQYLGLGLYVLAESILFVPILYIAAYFTDPSVLPTAAILTLTVFGGLTAITFVSKKDFSFMGNFLAVAGLVAFGVIACSIFFDFSLGIVFSGVMVLLAGGYVLYYTSNVMKHYPVGSHVAASLALFAAVALLFWYILRIVMSLSRN